jgi:hypothetical protein
MMTRPRRGNSPARANGHRESNMNNFNFGFALTVVGMGGTLVSLWLLTLVIHMLKMAFPRRANAGENDGGRS